VFMKDCGSKIVSIMLLQSRVGETYLPFFTTAFGSFVKFYGTATPLGLPSVPLEPMYEGMELLMDWSPITAFYFPKHAVRVLANRRSRAGGHLLSG